MPLFKAIPADTAIDLYANLIQARQIKLQPALNRAVKAVGVQVIDQQLQQLVPAEALNNLASLGLRGERVFPVPAILQYQPALIGYYRMLLGISQKEFGQVQRLGYGAWIKAENSNALSANQLELLDQFCSALIAPLGQLMQTMGQFNDRDLSDLSLLTLGSTLQGGRNNVIGANAATGVWQVVRHLLADSITVDTGTYLQFRTQAGATFQVVASGDPDIAFGQQDNGRIIPLIAIEIKGGRDASNAHNRAGEAEKSQLAAQRMGYPHRWTIIHMTGVHPEKIRQHTPTSTAVFEASAILQQVGTDWEQFVAQLHQILF